MSDTQQILTAKDGGQYYTTQAGIDRLNEVLEASSETDFHKQICDGTDVGLKTYDDVEATA